MRRCLGFPAGPISDPAGGLGCRLVFPYYPNGPSESYVIPADTSTFTYDDVGRVLTANNRSARITRTYTLNGTLESDALAYGSVTAPSVTDAVRTQTFTYDADGRRESMAWSGGTTQYAYTSFGALSEVTGPDGHHYRLTYDALGRVDSLTVTPASGGPQTVREARTYDADSRLTRRERRSVIASVGQLLIDNLTYSTRGLVRDVVTDSRTYAGPETIHTWYNPPGAVVAQERQRGGNTYLEEFRTDAYGNVFQALTRGDGVITNDAPFLSTYAPSGDLMARLSVPANPSLPFQQVVEQAQTTQGGVVTQQSILTSQPVTGTPGPAVQVAVRSWYSGDRKLMAVQRYEQAGGSTSAFGTWEEYRTDALGRRILTRVRRQPSPKPDSSNTLCQDLNGTCGSYVERTLRDGAQILGEWRTSEGTPTGITSGQVGYVYLDRLDQPIGLLTGDTTRVVQYTWRCLAEGTVFIDGTRMSGGVGGK